MAHLQRIFIWQPPPFKESKNHLRNHHQWVFETIPQMGVVFSGASNSFAISFALTLVSNPQILKKKSKQDPFSVQKLGDCVVLLNEYCAYIVYIYIYIKASNFIQLLRSWLHRKRFLWKHVETSRNFQNRIATTCHHCTFPVLVLHLGAHTEVLSWKNHQQMRSKEGFSSKPSAFLSQSLCSTALS